MVSSVNSYNYINIVSPLLNTDIDRRNNMLLNIISTKEYKHTLKIITNAYKLLLPYLYYHPNLNTQAHGYVLARRYPQACSGMAQLRFRFTHVAHVAWLGGRHMSIRRTWNMSQHSKYAQQFCARTLQLGPGTYSSPGICNMSPGTRFLLMSRSNSYSFEDHIREIKPGENLDCRPVNRHTARVFIQNAIPSVRQ
jgi:hypothetical protein